MRLVSVWIEEYMALKDLGFNLGDEIFFKFTFDPNKRFLTIDAEKTKEYFDLFSDSAIRNITGVIGNNGSGKTNFLKLLNLIEAKKPITYCAVLVFKNEKEKKYYAYNYTDFTKLNKITIEEAKGLNELLGVERWSLTDEPNPFKKNEILFYSNIYSEQNDNYLKAENGLNRSVDYLTRQSLNLDDVLEYSEKFKKKPEGLIPNRVQYNVSKLYFEKRFEKLLRFISIVRTEHHELEEIINTIPFPEFISINFQEDLFAKVIQLVSNSQYEFSRLEEIIKYCFENLQNEKDVIVRFQNEIIFKLFLYAFKEDLFKNTQPITKLEELESFIKGLSLENNIFKEILYYMKEKRNENFFYQIEKLNSILIKMSNGSYRIEIGEEKLFTLYTYNLRVTNECWKFIKDINGLFEIDPYPLISFRWHSLSAGQEAILNQFTELWLGFKEANKEDLIVSIDEGELYLHPEWQRQYIDLLYKLFSYCLKINKTVKRVQFVLTSHSPFMVSDIPKFSLIFLDRTQANRETPRPDVKLNDSQTHSATFGGNIFDLYKDSFFLKDFIGSFSLSRIEEAFKKTNSEVSVFKSESDLASFIQIIGEKVIRDVLESNLLDEHENGYEIINLTEMAMNKLNRTKKKLIKKKPIKKVIKRSAKKKIVAKKKTGKKNSNVVRKKK